ncbi:MAG: hypothetical protein ABIH27_05790 [Candidatus Omnitrophota bacterium]
MMRRIFSVAFLNFKQGVREKIFLGVIFFFIFFLALCLFLGELSAGESQKVLRSAGLAGIELSSVILVIFSLVLSFYKDKETHFMEICLGYYRRTEYLSGKLIGFLFICLTYLFLCALGYSLLLWLYQAFLWPVLAGVAALFLKLVIIISLALLSCCIFSSSLVALMASLFVYLASERAYMALQIVALDNKGDISLKLFKLLYYSLPNMNRLDIKPLVIYGKLPDLNFILSLSLYSLTYALLLWLIARLIFLKKEY